MKNTAILALLCTLASAGSDHHDGPIKYTKYPYAERGDKGYGTQPLREFYRRSKFEDILN